MKNLTKKEINKHNIDLYFKDKKIGDCVRDVDGYFYFWQYDDGCWSSYQLKEVAEILDELNKEWDEQVKTLQNE